MRIRNYFFLVLGFILIGVISGFEYKKLFTPISSSLVSMSPSSLISISSLDTASSTSEPASLPSSKNATSNALVLNSNPPSSSPSITSLIKTSQKIDKTQVAKITPIIPKKFFKLDIPYFNQQYANSCEAASLRMALAYYGVKISDDLDIVKSFGYKPRDKDVVNNEWDDPQEMFVGDIDIVGSTKGYGVYGKPVVKAAISYGRDAYLETNITANFLSKEIKAGHPIILWGYTSLTAPAYTWNLAGGGEAKAFKGEHARLVVGFEGEVNNPTGFYVSDPFNDNESEYWTVGKLMGQVNAVPGVTNQAVVVK